MYQMDMNIHKEFSILIKIENYSFTYTIKIIKLKWQQ